MQGRMASKWTTATLNREHPLPDGWRWDVDFGAPPVARRGDGIGSIAVYVDEHQELVSEQTVISCDFPDDTMRVDPPVDVALAVLLAHMAERRG